MMANPGRPLGFLSELIVTYIPALGDRGPYFFFQLSNMSFIFMSLHLDPPAVRKLWNRWGLTALSSRAEAWLRAIVIKKKIATPRSKKMKLGTNIHLEAWIKNRFPE